MDIPQLRKFKVGLDNKLKRKANFNYYKHTQISL